MHDNIKKLIDFRIQQANETIKEVEFQIENNYLINLMQAGLPCWQTGLRSYILIINLLI